MKLHCLPLIVAFLSTSLGGKAENVTVPTKAPALIVLMDQFEKPQRVAFPTTNIVVLTIADHKGSEEIAGWVTPLKSRYGEKVAIRGIADVRRVPGFLRNRIRKQFQEKQQHSVMMDWSGTNCAVFKSQLGVANIFIIGRDGTILFSQRGSATEKELKKVFNSIDSALTNSAGEPTRKNGAPTAERP